jgi:hypothetical protein
LWKGRFALLIRHSCPHLEAGIWIQGVTGMAGLYSGNKSPKSATGQIARLKNSDEFNRLHNVLITHQIKCWKDIRHNRPHLLFCIRMPIV